MKIPCFLLMAIFLMAGCKAKTRVEPQENIYVEPSPDEAERSPNVHDVSDSLLTSIDSIVDKTDMNSHLDKEKDTINLEKDSKQLIIYEMQFNKKNKRLVKGLLSRRATRFQLTSTSYFSNNKLIKIEAALKGKNDDRCFIYYHDDIPIYFSGHLLKKTAEAMRNEAYTLLDHAKQYQQ